MQRTIHEVLELRDLIVACDAVANKLLHAAGTARDADVVQMLGAHERTYRQQCHQLKQLLSGEGGLYGITGTNPAGAGFHHADGTAATGMGGMPGAFGHHAAGGPAGTAGAGAWSGPAGVGAGTPAGGAAGPVHPAEAGGSPGYPPTGPGTYSYRPSPAQADHRYPAGQGTTPRPAGDGWRPMQGGGPQPVPAGSAGPVEGRHHGPMQGARPWPMRGGSPEAGWEERSYARAQRADRPELVGWEPGAGNDEGWQAGARREATGPTMALSPGGGTGFGEREAGGRGTGFGEREAGSRGTGFGGLEPGGGATRAALDRAGSWQEGPAGGRHPGAGGHRGVVGFSAGAGAAGGPAVSDLAGAGGFSGAWEPAGLAARAEADLHPVAGHAGAGHREGLHGEVRQRMENLANLAVAAGTGAGTGGGPETRAAAGAGAEAGVGTGAGTGYGAAGRIEARRDLSGETGGPAESFTAVRPVGYAGGRGAAGGAHTVPGDATFRGHWTAQSGPAGGPGTPGARFDSPRVGFRPEWAPGTGPAGAMGPAAAPGTTGSPGSAQAMGPGGAMGPGTFNTFGGAGAATSPGHAGPATGTAPGHGPVGMATGPATGEAARGAILTDPDALAIADCLQDCKHMAVRLMVAASECSDRHLRRTLYQMAGQHLEMAGQHYEWLRRRGLYTVPPADPSLIHQLQQDIQRIEQAVRVVPAGGGVPGPAWAAGQGRPAGGSPGSSWAFSPGVPAGGEPGSYQAGGPAGQAPGGAVNTHMAYYPSGGHKGAFGGQAIRN